MVKSSFFNQITVNQSFYGAPLPRLVSLKLYLWLYFIQVVHSYGKMLFLAPNNWASLTFVKEKLCFQVACLDRVYLCQKTVIFRLCLLHEDGLKRVSLVPFDKKE